MNLSLLYRKKLFLKNTEKERLAIALSYGKPLYTCQNDCTYEGAGSLQAIGDTGSMPLNKSFPPG